MKEEKDKKFNGITEEFLLKAFKEFLKSKKGDFSAGLNKDAAFKLLGVSASKAAEALTEVKRKNKTAPNVATPLGEIEIDGETHQIQLSIIGNKKMFLNIGISVYDGFKMENILN